MIEPSESGSLYDFVGDDYQAPIEQPKPRERTVGQFANRTDMSTPYVNKEMPQHVTEAMTVVQEDNSRMAWWRLFTGQIPKCSFERDVNDKFGGRPPGEFNYKEKQAQYISFYKESMKNL